MEKSLLDIVIVIKTDSSTSFRFTPLRSEWQTAPSYVWKVKWKNLYLSLILSLKQIPPLHSATLHFSRNDKPLHPMFARWNGEVFT